MWIDAGSRAETQETNGTAHFLEHLAFKVRFEPFESSRDDADNDIGHCQAIPAATRARDREHGWSPQRVHFGKNRMLDMSWVTHLMHCVA